MKTTMNITIDEAVETETEDTIDVDRMDNEEVKLSRVVDGD